MTERDEKINESNNLKYLSRVYVRCSHSSIYNKFDFNPHNRLPISTLIEAHDVLHVYISVQNLV